MIFGDLTANIDEKGVAVLKNTCGQSEYDIGKIIIGDSNAVEVVEEGAGTLQVLYNHKEIEISVTSYESPVDFDLYIKANDDGICTLERK